MVTLSRNKMGQTTGLVKMFGRTNADRHFFGEVRIFSYTNSFMSLYVLDLPFIPWLLCSRCALTGSIETVSDGGCGKLS